MLETANEARRKKASHDRRFGAAGQTHPTRSISAGDNWCRYRRHYSSLGLRPIFGFAAAGSAAAGGRRAGAKTGGREGVGRGREDRHGGGVYRIPAELRLRGARLRGK